MSVESKYELEIYGPGETAFDGDATCNFESAQPFLPIQRGDLVNPRVWTTHYQEQLKYHHPPTEYGTLLRVTAVEHIICQRDDLSFSTHKVCIYTEALDDVAESRQQQTGTRDEA
jgi:hypothetical protein